MSLANFMPSARRNWNPSPLLCGQIFAQNQISGAPRHRRDVVSATAAARWWRRLDGVEITQLTVFHTDLDHGLRRFLRRERDEAEVAPREEQDLVDGPVVPEQLSQDGLDVVELRGEVAHVAALAVRACAQINR